MKIGWAAFPLSTTFHLIRAEIGMPRRLILLSALQAIFASVR
jgi:hypothetical protein